MSTKKSEFHLDYERVKSIEVRSKCHDSRFSGVDILISTDWPKGYSQSPYAPLILIYNYMVFICQWAGSKGHFTFINTFEKFLLNRQVVPKLV